MATALNVTQDAPSCSEHELVAAVRRGNDRAFEQLYSRYRARIGSYVFGMLGDHARAEDIAQEVFISALRRLRATERPIAFKPWIYEIAKNACIDEFRRSRRSREVPLETDDDAAAPPRLITHGPDAAVENRQRLDDLRGAFGGLSESHHRIIVMREFEGRSYSQIGESLGMSKPVVESTLFRARRRLSEEYDELVSGRRCERVQTVIAAEGERPLHSLGIRERRLLARHLSHCQPCRRQARMAGVDESFFHAPGLAAKIAALLPLPWLPWRRSGSRAGNDPAAAGTPHSSALIQSFQNVAPLADPSGPAASLGRAVATAAAIVVAGAGGGLVTGLGGHASAFPAVRATTSAGSPPATARHATHGIARSHSTAIHSGSTIANGKPRPVSKHAPGSPGSAGGVHTFAPSGSGTNGNASSGATSLGSAARQPVPAASAATSKVLGSGSSPSGGPGSSGGSVSTPKLPSAQLPSAQLPPVSIPNLPSNPLGSVPKPQPPTVSVPNLSPLPVPDPTSLLPPLGSQSKTH